MSGGFVWYELITPDIAGAKAFYDAVVGWTVEERSAFPNGYRMIGRSDGKSAGGMLPLTPEMAEHGARPIWLGYVDVDNVDRTLADMEQDGARALMPAFDIPAVGRVALIADPWGAPLYLMTPTPPPGQPDAASDVFSVDRPEHVRWNELATDDQAGAAFYGRHFGWKQNGEMPMGELGEYQFLEAGGVMIGAVMRRPPAMPASSWTYYIGVDDIDRAASAIGAGGGTIIQEPIEIPGGEFSLVAADPQDAAFGLVGPRNR